MSLDFIDQDTTIARKEVFRSMRLEFSRLRITKEFTLCLVVVVCLKAYFCHYPLAVYSIVSNVNALLYLCLSNTIYNYLIMLS